MVLWPSTIIFACCCNRQKAFWDQIVSDDEDDEALDHSREPEETGSSVTSFPAKSLSVSAKSKKAVSEPHEVQECAFCRSEVCSLFSVSPTWVSLCMLTLKGPGVCLNGIRNDLYEAPMSIEIRFYSVYDSESIFSTSYKEEVKNIVICDNNN